MNEEKVEFRQNGERVLIIWSGKLAADLHYSGALELADALRRVGRMAEQWSNAEAVARDEAILLRSGVPVSLTSNPVMRAEAEKLAVSDRELRRAMPGGVKSEEHVGAPVIVRGTPDGTS